MGELQAQECEVESRQDSLQGLLNPSPNCLHHRHQPSPPNATTNNDILLYLLLNQTLGDCEEILWKHVSCSMVSISGGCADTQLDISSEGVEVVSLVEGSKLHLGS